MDKAGDGVVSVWIINPGDVAPVQGLNFYIVTSNKLLVSKVNGETLVFNTDVGLVNDSKPSLISLFPAQKDTRAAFS